MSTVEDIGKVDSIGFVSPTNSVVLKVFDHLDWSDVQGHLFTLQEKLNAYIDFVASGQIYDAYPKARDRNLIVSIDFKYELPAEAEVFLAQANKILSHSQLTLEYQAGLG